MSHIELTARDIEMLTRVYQINQTLSIKAGKAELRAVNHNNTIAIIAPLSIPLPRTLSLYDVREFINVLNLIDEPVLDLTDPKSAVVYSKKTGQRLRYVDGAPELINSYFEKEFKLPSNDIELTVSAEHLKRTKEAAALMKLDYIGFIADGKTVKLCAFKKNNGDGGITNTYEITLGETAAEYNMFFTTASLAVVSGECVFSISKMKLSRIQASGAVFWMALDGESSYTSDGAVPETDESFDAEEEFELEQE